MQIKSSFSQHNLFEKCARGWVYTYLKKIKVPQNMMHAHAGSVIHTCLDKFYNGEVSNIRELKILFNNEWTKYKLETTDLKLKKDQYWLMIVNGANLALTITKTELKIDYSDVVAYIDGVDEINHKLLDWKSSTRRPDTFDDEGNVYEEGNESEYIKQLKLYCWLYYRKYNILPSEAIVYYLKYSGTKQSLSFTPTMEDIFNIEDWYYDILNKMATIKYNNIIPPVAEQCHFFCPFKNICGTGESPRLVLNIWGNKLKLDGPITKLLNIGINKKFSYEFKDAYWIEKYNEKHNKNVKTIKEFWNPSKRELPIGFKDSLMKTLNDFAAFKKMKFNLKIVDNREFNDKKIEMPEKFINNIILRDYQQAAVKSFMRARIGLLEIGTGGGKTEISIECIRLLGMKTLFIVDRKELLKQTKKRIEKSLGIEVGTITAGKFEPQDITVATIQTLLKKIDFTSRINQYKASIKNNYISEQLKTYIESEKLDEEIDKNQIESYQNKLSHNFKYTDEDNNKINEISKTFYNEYVELAKYLRSIRFGIFDECHKVASRSYVIVGDEMTNTEYRLGITGTGFRDDGNDMMIYGVVGDIIHKLDADNLINNGWLTKPTIKFIEKYMTKEEIDKAEDEALTGLINETPKYSNMYHNFITKNSSRNKQIVKIINDYKGKKILILVKLIEHGNLLEETIEGSKYLHGSTNKKDRDQMFKDFTEGNLNVLISTISIFAEGIDVPQLDVVLNASANKGDVKTIQVLGRVLRKLDGKKEALYIDFVDETKFFRKASIVRMKILREQGHTIEKINVSGVNENE